MSLDKLSITLYDILAYLLPGGTVLVGLSALEASFCKTHLLALSHFPSNILLAILAAYFGGAICHSLGSILKSRFFRWFTDSKDDRLHNSIYDRVRDTAVRFYGLTLNAGEKIDPLSLYQLADSYVVANGGSAERDTLVAREGFYKASMVAFGLLFIFVISTFLAGGMKIRTYGNTLYAFGAVGTGVAAIVAFIAMLICRRSLVFYGRLKKNNVLVVFLALRRRSAIDKK